MKIQHALALVPLVSAFVIHDADVFSTIEKTGRRVLEQSQSTLDDIEKSAEDAFNKGQAVLEQGKTALDEALDKAFGTVKTASEDAYANVHKAGFDVESWLESATNGDTLDITEAGRGHPHHSPPNLTVYELISKSNYTTKLAALIDEYPDIVEALNSTEANYTIFAPIDSAFEHIPKHGHHKPSKEDLKKVLLYHVTDSLYPAGRVLSSYTIPTLFTPSDPNLLGHAQRLTPRITLKGPTINYYSRLVALDIFGTNGVIHGIEYLLFPPPQVATIIDLLPSEFSTLELALGKTGLWEKVNTTEYPHNGGTFFAPSNFAFQKLGPEINAFLFSKYGLKYLKALLEYHIVVSQTLYSDAYYDGTSDDSATASPPYTHIDLPTLLSSKSLAVDIARYGPFISIKINGFSSVTTHDGVASDGVIQVVSDVLIPPKKPGSGETEADGFWKGEELSVEDFKDRLQPFVEENMEL